MSGGGGTALTRRSFVKGAAAAAAAPWVPMSRQPRWTIPPAEPQDVPLYDLEVWQAADLIRRRIVSPVELAEATLERIAETEPRIETFVNQYPADEIMAQAEAAEDEIAAGRYLGPLHGITVGLKDIYLTEGKVTEGNSGLYRGFTPSFDATSVARIKAAGAVIVGKVGTSELATADQWPAKNPWDFESSCRRIQHGLRDGCRGVPVHGGNGHLHRRFNPWSGRQLRHHRAQAHLRSHQPARGPPPRVVHGPPRPDGPQRPGRGAGAGRGGWRRPTGPAHPQGGPLPDRRGALLGAPAQPP